MSHQKSHSHQNTPVRNPCIPFGTGEIRRQEKQVRLSQKKPAVNHAHHHHAPLPNHHHRTPHCVPRQWDSAVYNVAQRRQRSQHIVDSLERLYSLRKRPCYRELPPTSLNGELRLQAADTSLPWQQGLALLFLCRRFLSSLACLCVCGTLDGGRCVCPARYSACSADRGTACSGRRSPRYCGGCPGASYRWQAGRTTR